ncbi:MAG TPA: phosphate ABC transporter permease subunit PstC [Bryobacteraceae bacterium]|jgi:phosphate transport system permease protein|nr:phosphate ABC transporter permease subunit PstC [Bryobacteraceae bacterium]
MSAFTTTDFRARPPGRALAFWTRLRRGDEVAYTVTLTCALSILAITALLVFELYTNSAETRHKFGWSFLSTSVWDPVAGEFGALPFIYGTVVTSALALLIGIPLGVGAAIFLAELAPAKISNALTFLIELLAAVPSVIYGLLGIFVLVPMLRSAEPAIRAVLGWTPLFSGPFYGVSLFSAGVVLTIMIVPFIISISREVILAVPNEQREGALALGATRWETTWNVVIPFARKGIMGSIFLALARSLGETMAVTMVVGNDPKIHASLFAPGYSIAAVIANEFTEATGGLYQSALIELGLVLFGLTMVINGVARLLVLGTTRKGAA